MNAENQSQVVFRFTKSRKQRAWLFINMGVMCWVYIAAMYAYEHFYEPISQEQTRNIMLYGFGLASLVLFYIAYWHRKHPGQYEALVTKTRLIIHYPNSSQWSFDVAIADIKRFEYRQSLSHAGRGIMQQGVLLNDGRFKHISMNYGLNLGELHKAVKQVKPNVAFPSTINRKVEGVLGKDYDN